MAESVRIEQVENAVSALFVPGDRPERFSKAHNSGAHLVILDLEDAVAPENKKLALDYVVEALTKEHEDIPGGKLTALVRVNSDNVSVELAALRDIASVKNNGLLGVMIPKTESARHIADAKAALPAGMAIVALIETAQALVAVHEIAQASGLTRLAFGAVDFGADVDSAHPDILGYARAQVLVASAAVGLAAPLDSPTLEIKNTQQVATDARLSRERGYGGKMAIHPTQVVPIHEGFEPSKEELSWAEKILAHEGSATQVDGVMVDKPVLERAKKIMRRSERLNS